MGTASIPRVLGFSAQNNSDRFAARRANPSIRAGTLDRAMVFGSIFLIVALLDINCILWINPITDQLAKWAGVSFLNSVLAGVGAMLASIPVVLAATILACRAIFAKSRREQARRQLPVQTKSVVVR